MCIRDSTEARMTVERLRDDNKLDVSDPEVGKVIISALTPHQAVCFYLYYSERMSVREVGQLLQIDHCLLYTSPGDKTYSYFVEVVEHGKKNE